MQKAYEISLGVEKNLTELKEYLEQNGIKVEEVSELSTASFHSTPQNGQNRFTPRRNAENFSFMGNECKDIPYPPFKKFPFRLLTR